MKSNTVYWLGGVLIALVGVALVRLLPEPMAILRATGFALAGVGLFIVALGVRHRIDHES